MISRVWHGWTKAEHADEYEGMLRAEVLPGIHRVSGVHRLPGVDRLTRVHDRLPRIRQRLACVRLRAAGAPAGLRRHRDEQERDRGALQEFAPSPHGFSPLRSFAVAPMRTHRGRGGKEPSGKRSYLGRKAFVRMPDAPVQRMNGLCQAEICVPKRKT